MSSLSLETFNRVLKVYGEAWVSRDPERILGIFTEDAAYYEDPLATPYRGHEGIASYWRQRVVAGQADIEFTILATYIDGNTGIAEWEVFFTDILRSTAVHMKEGEGGGYHGVSWRSDRFLA